MYGGRTEESYHSRYDRNCPLVPPAYGLSPSLVHIYIIHTVYLLYRSRPYRESSCRRMCTCSSIVRTRRSLGGGETSLIKCIPTRCQIQSSENPAVVPYVYIYACVCLPSAIKLIAVSFGRNWITKPIL